MKTFIYIVITVVAVSVIAGFFIVGSPKEERARKQDDQRVQHLQFIQSEIINYWISKEKIPEGLSVLEDSIRGIIIPKDPETGADYKYEIIDTKNLKFSLCADFKMRSLELENPRMPQPAEPYFTQQNWSHGPGAVCFDRTIDRDFYKPKTK